ncbi:MAG: choice-of-anchor J domain-containing protein [Mediterranea sp.]|jgi:hypothetical protein|nr:choice-of-anchor J domain-containing protein [Mediterranea sp.]
MKKILFTLPLLLASLTACDDWNEQFDIKHELTDVKNITLTLADADYAAIAANKTNQELALEKSPEDSAVYKALKQLGTNKYFTDQVPAEDYLPAWIKAKYPNASEGSKFMITYNQFTGLPTYLSAYDNLSVYTLNSDDYKTVWGDNLTASYLSPKTVGKIASLLGTGTNGEMKVVNYAYSETEPSTGGGGGSGEVTYDKISDATSAAGSYNVKGNVLATYARGFLLGDDTGSILVYLNNMPNVTIGDEIAVEGTTTAYAGLMQFPNSSTVTRIASAAGYKAPTYTTMDAAAMDAYLTAPVAKPITYTGKLSISNNYYNVAIEGAATAIGSLQYIYPGTVDPTLNNKTITVYGYAIGVSSGKYVNTMVTKVIEAGNDNHVPVIEVAMGEAKEYSVQGTVMALYDRGFLLSDGTASILVYNSKTDVKQGSIATVKGTTSAYAGLKQFDDKSVVDTISSVKYTYPDALVLTPEAMDAYIAAPYIAYVQYTGKLSITGTAEKPYYNIAIDGAAIAQGSLSYPKNGDALSALKDKQVTVTGYTIGSSSGKYVNTMITSVVEASAAPATRTAFTTRALPATRAGEPTANAAKLYRYNNNAWAEQKTENKGIKVHVITPTTYTDMGSTTMSDANIPTYLASQFPYAPQNDSVVVVYNSNNAKKYVGKEYTFTDNIWKLTTNFAPESTTLTPDQSGTIITANSYIEATFTGGNDGGFTIQNVETSGLNYVWKLDNTYGWKASAFANNTNTPAESWIVSPALDFKKAIAPQLTFDEAHQYLNGDAADDHFAVCISSDYVDNVATATWTTLEVTNWGPGTNWDFTTIEPIDLSAFKGQKVYVAFRYISTSVAAPTWEIKNLFIRE